MITRLSHPGLRPFQSEMEKTLYERMMSGAALTVAWCAAGSGKTKGYFNASQRAFSEGLIRYVVAFVPRITLRLQAEADCDEWRMHYLDPVIGKILGQVNDHPLTRADEAGYISTYAALVANPRLHLDWAKAHAGQFILVCDEAQFLGLSSSDDDDSSGTQAAALIEQYAKYARHTLLTTGTIRRSDGGALVLATYSEPDHKGYRYLDYDLKASYQDGVRLRYLRPAQFGLTNGTVTFSDLATDEISELEKRLHKVLREPAVWQTLCHKIVDQLSECRRSWSRYRALISCIDQNHARRVFDYLSTQYPALKIKLAVSDNGKEAQAVLKAFRPKEKGGRDDGDILVTVGMVSIGYDCPTICVVGNLSSRRWTGWLEQFFARGARVWEKGGPPIDDQLCFYISTDDPRNRRFAERMRRESEEGIKERNVASPPPPPSGPDVSIIDVEMTDEEVLGLNADQDLSPAELVGLRELQRKLTSGRYVPETVMAEIFRAAGHPIPTGGAETSGGKTNSEKRKDMRTRVAKMLARYVIVVYDLPTGSPEYSKTISMLSAFLNKTQDVENINHCTEAQLNERARIIDQWIASGARQ